jgi:tRNA-specific 2-thiouridylase
MSERIAVALSGGVDSSVAAALLSQAGHALVGVTMQLRPPRESDGEPALRGGDAITRARAVAETLGFPHHVLDCAPAFAELVLRPAWRDYASGRTPSPCLLCNERVKFGLLLDWVGQLGLARLATGHYARVARDASGRPQHLRKPEVRGLARDLGLSTAETKESQDACVALAGETFAEVLRGGFGAPAQPGAIVDETGALVGEHAGIHFFTIGQRKGLPAGARARRWVKSISPATGQVTLTSDPRAILGTEFVAKEPSWLGVDLPRAPLACSVQVRYRHPSEPATVVARADGSLAVTLERPAKAITPGQAAVFYDGDRVLGRGWIADG